jgi:hypothetical protein
MDDAKHKIAPHGGGGGGGGGLRRERRFEICINATLFQ